MGKCCFSGGGVESRQLVIFKKSALSRFQNEQTLKPKP